jgi:predicted DNA-binding transcriptional regulator AlpA
MGRRVDVDKLIDTQDVARLLGLSHRNTVSEYQAKYDDMPRPVIDLGRGRTKLWLRPEVERWYARQVAAGRTRAKRGSPDVPVGISPAGERRA